MTAPSTITLALGQMLVEGGQPEANLARALEMIRDGGRRGCQAIVLPECMDLGWTDPSAREWAEPIPGPRSDRLAAAAREADILVVSGLTERAGSHTYNAAVLIAPSGEILLKHRKINLLDIEQDPYAVGDRLGVAHTPLGTIGVNICADNFLSCLELGHSLGRMGARLILSPSAWAVDAQHQNPLQPYDHWEKPYAELAKTHGLTVVGVSNVGWIRGGPWQGKKCIGCSLVVGPDGAPLHKSPYGETAACLEVVDIPLMAPVAPGSAPESGGNDKKPVARTHEFGG